LPKVKPEFPEKQVWKQAYITLLPLVFDGKLNNIMFTFGLAFIHLTLHQRLRPVFCRWAAP